MLLLSATPYKPYTFAEEDEDHHREFLELLRFLNDDVRWLADVRRALGAYREAAIAGKPVDDIITEVRELLLTVMCRTERPRLAGSDDMLVERVHPAAPVQPSELVDFAALRGLARELKTTVTVEYWKSAPYFVNFCDGYQFRDRLGVALTEQREPIAKLVARTQHLDTDALRRFQPVPMGNARLRRLAEQTVDADWWQLLWMPPSMPYQQPEGPFVNSAGMTKRLLFSSWAATPTAVATLLSYEAERRIAEGRLIENTPEARRNMRPRLTFRMEGDRPAAMNVLAAFWPHPALAELCDPRQAAGEHGDGVPTLMQMRTELREALRNVVLGSAASGHDRAPWESFFGFHDGLPHDQLDAESIADALSGTEIGDTDQPGGSGVLQHVQTALAHQRGAGMLPAVGEDALDELVELGAFAPGNIAWRAVGRLLAPGHRVSDRERWIAAATLANGIRTLFNRVESTLLLDRLYPELSYWRSVLSYAAAGDLQAVLDEYLHHLRSNLGDQPLDGATLDRVVKYASDALSLRPARYQAFDPTAPDQPIAMNCRFALRYGNRWGTEDDARLPEVRNAFNSPFWPFVLATTSVGQEGIDFHWWCSSVVHWNTPANPVDFEQREGRVHRFGSHAVRRNIAARHRGQALLAPDADPWQAAYQAAGDAAVTGDEFAPWWIYPGEAKIERQLLPFPLSRDLPRAEQVKQDLARYRLTFGQPRQEDMIGLLRTHGVDANEIAAVDLRPPGPLPKA